ncbi:hypothetical protein G7054_g13907 [Neopestalotiopsis clavispora]|nr:hypothetical protein G7054_g13907 [Neopestalotiopsis clavispora]
MAGVDAAPPPPRLPPPPIWPPQQHPPAVNKTAKCRWTHKGLIHYAFLIHDINNWVNDNGTTLAFQLKGCSRFLFSDFKYLDDRDLNPLGARARFLLPIIFRGGCVERAIVSAGGPVVNCTYHNNDEWHWTRGLRFWMGEAA